VIAENFENARSALVMSDMEYDWDEDELTSNVWGRAQRDSDL
jgi:hypothetical protein